MQVIILAAGEGKRIKSLTKGRHKSLLPINSNDTFLSRILHQLNEYEISKLVVVTGYESKSIESVVSNFQMNTEIIYNNRYSEDTNIYSMKLGLDCIDKNETIIIIEADIYMDDLAFKQIFFESKKNNSIWFTRGIFKESQYGGILSINNKNVVQNIKIVNKYEDQYENYFKLLGITTIGKYELNTFTKLINQYVEQTIKQYYLIPWIENLNILPCNGYNIEEDLVTSFNKENEYHTFIDKLKKEKIYLADYKLININKIYPIEGFIEERKIIIQEKILKDGCWTKPIIVDKKNNLIMDGHHRYQSAKDLGFNKIPVISIDYDDVPIWSLKSAEIVTKELVKDRALNGKLYPCKTVKHKFYFEIKPCNINLENLN